MLDLQAVTAAMRAALCALPEAAPSPLCQLAALASSALAARVQSTSGKLRFTKRLAAGGLAGAACTVPICAAALARFATAHVWQRMRAGLPDAGCAPPPAVAGSVVAADCQASRCLAAGLLLSLQGLVRQCSACVGGAQLRMLLWHVLSTGAVSCLAGCLSLFRS